MKDSRRNYALVGSFVLAMLVALLVWIAALSGGTGATDRYTIRYANVMGLAAGTQILFEGYPVGLVEDIERVSDVPEPHFRVDADIRRGWRIPDDSMAEITASGLLSAVVIDIREGKSPTALEPGAVIPSIESANVFAAITSVADQLGDLSENSLRPLLESLGEGAPAIVENFESFSVALNDTVDQLNAILSPANAARIQHILRNLESTTDQVVDVTGGLAETRRELDRVVRGMNQLLERNEADLTHAIADLHHSLEAVAVRIDAISHNLEVTSRNMNEFSGQIRANPGILLRGRDVRDDASAAD